jgi:hypothetical protein
MSVSLLHESLYRIPNTPPKKKLFSLINVLSRFAGYKVKHKEAQDISIHKG